MFVSRKSRVIYISLPNIVDRLCVHLNLRQRSNLQHQVNFAPRLAPPVQKMKWRLLRLSPPTAGTRHSGLPTAICSMYPYSSVLEPDVGKRIDKLSHATKLDNISETAKEITNFSAEITFKRHKACFLPCAALHCLTRCSVTSPPPFCH